MFIFTFVGAVSQVSALLSNSFQLYSFDSTLNIWHLTALKIPVTHNVCCLDQQQPPGSEEGS